MSEVPDFKVTRFAENRAIVAVIEFSAWAIPHLIVLLLLLPLYHDHKNGALSRSVQILIILLGISILSAVFDALRINAIIVEGPDLLVVQNMIRKYRIPFSQVTSVQVAKYNTLARVAGPVRVVVVTYSDIEKGKEFSAPVVASFSKGRQSALMEEILRMSRKYSFSCDLSDMIY